MAGLLIIFSQDLGILLKKTRFTRVLKWPTRAKKGPIYTQTCHINYYYRIIQLYRMIGNIGISGYLF
jgi:hypothetical protein